MSVEAGSPITTYFRVCDGVRVRFADAKADSEVTVLLLAPWPESLWAFRRIWDRLSAVGRVVALDMPGFGHSEGRPELIAPDASGAFLAGLIDEWDLGAPHVGTAAALFLAARAPERVTSLTVGDRFAALAEELLRVRRGSTHLGLRRRHGRPGLEVIAFLVSGCPTRRSTPARRRTTVRRANGRDHRRNTIEPRPDGLAPKRGCGPNREGRRCSRRAGGDSMKKRRTQIDKKGAKPADLVRVIR